MKTRMPRFALCAIAATALSVGTVFAQEPSLSEQQYAPQPPEEITPTNAPQAPAGQGTAPLDPRSRSYLVHSLTESLGLDLKQVAEMNKIIDSTIAEREKNAQKGKEITEKGTRDLVDLLTPEQKDRAAEMLISRMTRGPLMPGPGDTGFRKWQPGRIPPGGMARPGMMPPAMGGGAGPGVSQMLRERLAAHADDIIRARAAQTLQLSPDQAAKAKSIETAREAAVDKATKDAEQQFRAALTQEQLRKYDAMRERMKQRMEERLEQPDESEPTGTEKP